jgi:hypothetical protein
MRHLSWSLLLIATAGSAEVLWGEQPPDAEIEKLIIGKWISPNRTVKVEIGDTTTTYRDDHTFVSETPIRQKDGASKTFTASGTWKVANSKITQSFDKYDPPQALPKASVMFVIEINKRVFRSCDERGKIFYTMFRVTDGTR